MEESNLLNAAIEHQRLGQNAEAKNIYVEILKKLPDSEIALNNMGTLEATLGNYLDASKYFARLVSLVPKNLNALINYASALELCNDLNGAIKAFSRALEINSNNLKLLLRLGALFKKIGKHKEAQEIYEKVLFLEPENLEALNNLGNVLRDIGKIDDALSYLTQAVNAHGSNEIIYNNIATIYSGIENYDKALEFYDLALIKNPSHILSLNGKGIVLRELGRLDEAISYFEMAVAVDPHSLISQSNLAGAFIASKKQDDEKILQAKKAIDTYLDNVKREKNTSISFFALKHHLGQAKYLDLNGIQVPGNKKFINSAEELINNFDATKGLIFLDDSYYRNMREYLGAYLEYEMPNNIVYGLNPNNNWKKIEEEYFDSKETIAIDNFLSLEALDALYKYCLISKVWIREYPKCYLGAFGYQGFISSLHLKIAKELSQYLPRVFQQYLLSHLWAFKYDSKLGSGINVHADPAKVNVNFWLTPDEFNLEKDRGGLVVYSKRAKEGWNFDTYNNDQDKIYEYLSEGDQDQINIPYKRNRCVLFNSVLFHETDRISFSDVYEGRRINMTYLFGQK